MKHILLAALLLLSWPALGQQQINGNTLVNGSIPLAKLAPIAADTIVCNNTSGSLTPLACTVSQIQTLLGLGTMSTQNANAVAITGGTALFTSAAGASTATSGISLGGGTGLAQSLFIQSTGATDGKLTDFVAVGGSFFGRLVNDANNSASNWLQVNRSGITPTGIFFGADVTAPDFIANAAGALTPNGFLLGGGTYGMGYDSGNLLFFANTGLALVITPSLLNYRIPSNYIFGWSASTANTTAIDTAFTRISPDVVGVGNGSAGDASGTVEAAVGAFTQIKVTGGSLLITSTAPTYTSGLGTGAAIVNTNGANVFTVSTGTGNVGNTVTFGMPTAAHGWAAYASTLGGLTVSVTSTSINSMTLTDFSATWLDSDTLQVIAFPY